MIVYPFGLAIFGMFIVTLIGMAIFGMHSTDWADWQNELIGTTGTIFGFVGAVLGLWLAIRFERRVLR
jgi:hypothetical protein